MSETVMDPLLQIGSTAVTLAVLWYEIREVKQKVNKLEDYILYDDKYDSRTRTRTTRRTGIRRISNNASNAVSSNI